MFTKLVGAATLFAAGSLMAGGSTAIAATPVNGFGAEAALTEAGSLGAKDAEDAKKEGKAPAKAKDGKAKEGSCAKDGSCGKGSCGSKDKKDKKAEKDGNGGKEKKEHKEGACGKDKEKK